MKTKIVRLGIVVMMGLHAFQASGQSRIPQHTIKVNGDDLACSRYNGEAYFYAELSGKYKIPDTIFDHSFYQFLFIDSCAIVDDLKGSIHDVLVKVKVHPYQATICERGGSYYCHHYGCYLYRVEYVDLLFPNGLKLSSEVHTPLEAAPKIHDGQCSRQTSQRISRRL